MHASSSQYETLEIEQADGMEIANKCRLKAIFKEHFILEGKFH